LYKNTKKYNFLMETGHWGPVEAQLGIEAGFKCEYCGKDMFASVDNYKEWQTDHIVPASKGGLDDINNYVLSCKTCNFIKGTWNPLEHKKSKEPNKAELIELARAYITSKRGDISKDLELYKSIIAENDD
jgi:5-methylcytosine-specific restriction endonuclease McrA